MIHLHRRSEDRVRCTYCFEQVSGLRLQTCAGCATVLHPTCAMELKSCPTLGCERPVGARPAGRVLSARRDLPVVLAGQITRAERKPEPTKWVTVSLPTSEEGSFLSKRGHGSAPPQLEPPTGLLSGVPTSWKLPVLVGGFCGGVTAMALDAQLGLESPLMAPAGLLIGGWLTIALLLMARSALRRCP